MKYISRLIEEKDNCIIENLIKEDLIEYIDINEKHNDNDSCIGNFSSNFSTIGMGYFICEDENGKIVGGIGIGKIEGVENTCKLQKMYLIKNFDDTKIINELLKACLDFAKKYYNSVYIEIPDNNEKAICFFEEHGFKKIEEPLGNKEKQNGIVYYLLKFKTVSRTAEVLGEIFGELFCYLLMFLFGIPIMLILPDKCIEELDCEGIMAIGGILFLIVTTILVLLLRLIFRRKD